MGGNSSKLSPQNHYQQEPGFPDLPPYNACPIEYHFVAIKAELDSQSHFSFMGPNVTIQATNVEHYHPRLAALYRQGYKLLVFASHPGSIKSYELPSDEHFKTNVEFQAIFRKLLPEEKELELQVIKSTLSNQMFQKWSGDLLLNAGFLTGNVTNSDHIFETLGTIAQEGGRLVSVELTGMSRDQIEAQKHYMDRRAKMPHVTHNTAPDVQMAIDMFFEVTQQPCNDKYAYLVVQCPMTSSYHSGFPRGYVCSTIDWKNMTSKQLGKGWKLVDILEDYSTYARAGMRDIRVNGDQVKNCLWIFEKPLSRIADNTPRYEANVVEHWVRSRTHPHSVGEGTSTAISVGWEPVLEHSGKNGWQVVKILGTPDRRFEGTFQQTEYTKLLIFMQRLIVSVSGVTTEQVKMQPWESHMATDEETINSGFKL